MVNSHLLSICCLSHCEKEAALSYKQISFPIFREFQCSTAWSLWDQPTLGSKELGPQAEAIVTFKVLLVVTYFFQPASTPNGSRVLKKVPEVDGRSMKHVPVWDNLRSGAEMLPIHRHTFLNIRSTPTLSQAPHIQSFLWDLALCPKDICFSSIVSGFHRMFMPTCANTAPNF